MTNTPWTFEEAVRAHQSAREMQRQAEQFIVVAARDYAEKEREYRLALSKAITKLHGEGVAWSSTADLARGDGHVAQLKYERDVAEGVREAATQASWRAAGYRREVEQLTSWSMRRDLAEDPPEPAQIPTPFGRRTA